MIPTHVKGTRSSSQNEKLLLFVHNAASLLSIRIAGTAPADKPHLSNAAEQTNTQFVTLQTSLRPKLTQALQIQEKRWSDALRHLAEHRARRTCGRIDCAALAARTSERRSTNTSWCENCEERTNDKVGWRHMR